MSDSISFGKKRQKLSDSSLVMSDYWFLFGMWVVIFWAIDPFDAKFDVRPLIKHFPVFVIAPAFVLSFMGAVLFGNFKHKNKAGSGGPYPWLSIIPFAFFVIAGSIAARFVYKIENTFLTMGLYALAAPVTIWFIVRAGNSALLVRRLLQIYIFWSLIAIGMQAAYFAKRDVFHPKEHLVLGSLTMLFFLSKNNFAKAFSLLFIGATAIVAHKNTAYLTALLIYAYIFLVWVVVHWRTILDGMKRTAFGIKVGIFMVIGAGVVLLAYTQRGTSQPSGNPEYRLATYAKAWEKFLHSPIWGNGFSGAATEKFDKYTVAVSTQVLPTHSDPLDILAGGGVIGFVFWFAFFIGLARSWYACVKRSGDPVAEKFLPYIHTLYCMVFTGALVCMFNPILNAPNLAWSFWAAGGALLALIFTMSKQPLN